MVTFYQIDENGDKGAPVLYLDTLKVSTIEQTAENVEARGGKGNPALVSWDYGKEINVTLTDALFSAKSMAIMFGNGTAINPDATGTMERTVEWICKPGTTEGTVTTFTEVVINGKKYTTTSPTGSPAITDVHYYKISTGKTASTTDEVDAEDLVANEKYFVHFKVTAKDISTIEITSDSFPGTYYITGDTYARSSKTGLDEFFQFVIPKAKVQAENTITLEAEGDPSTFNLSLRVLRPDDGVMMKLIKYDLSGGTDV